jgi:hypothetical protein
VPEVPWWSAPDEEVHAFVNGFERTVGTYLYGGRMYGAMLYWESALCPTTSGWIWTSRTSGASRTG